MPFKSKFQRDKDLDIIEAQAHEKTNSFDLKDSLNGEESLDGGYGWFVLAGCFLLLFVVFGVNYTTGVFLYAYKAFIFKDSVSTATLAFIATASNAASCFSLIFAGRFSEKFGYRTTILLGAVLKGLAFILASFFTEFWHLLLTQGILSGISTALIYPIAVTAPAQWFKKRQGLAIGISVCGSGIGGFVFAPVLEKCIASLGVYWALRIVGIVSFVVLFILAFVIKERVREDPKTVEWSDFRIFKNKMFLIMLCGNLLLAFSDLLPQYLIPIFAGEVGISSEQGALLLSLISIGTVVGKFTIGLMGDFVGKSNVISLSVLSLSVLTFGIWSWARTFIPVAVYCFLYGVGYGGFVASQPALLAQTFGLGGLTSINGFILFGSGVPALIGIPVGLKILEAFTYENAKNFLPLILYTAAFNLAGGIFFVIFRYIVSPKLFKKI